MSAAPPPPVNNSAWNRGPPSNPSSGAQTPNGVSVNGNGNAPIGGGHSRKGSLMIGGGMDIKKGPLAFGTVESPNPLLSSSPAAPSMTGTHLADNVKSFGSIEADPLSRSAMASPTLSTPQTRKQPDMHAFFQAKPMARPPSMPPRSPVMSPAFAQQQYRPPRPQNGYGVPQGMPMQQGHMPMQPVRPPFNQQYMQPPYGYYPYYEQQYFPQQQNPMLSPRAIPASPSPMPAALPPNGSGGPSPVPTPPVRPPPPTPSRPNQYLSGGAATFTPRVSKAIKLTRDDGTNVDIKDLAAKAVPVEPTPEVKPESTPAKKPIALPIVVRIESEEQKKARMKEEADREKIRRIEEQEELERKERKERQAREAEERKAKEEAEAKAEEARRAEEAEALRQAEEARLAKEEEARKVEEAEASRKAAEAEAARQAEEAEASRKAAEAAKAEAKESTRPTPLEIPPAGPSSALSTARPIEDLTAITYPSAFKPPSPRLNSNAEPGKFRYDREFLMQFMQVCKEKPEGLPPLDEIGLEADSSSGFGSRGGPRSSRGGTARAPTGLGIGGIGRPSTNMGSFGTGNFGSIRGTTSEDRYARSLSSTRPQPSRQALPPMHGLPLMTSSASRSGTARSQRGTRRPAAPAFDPDVVPLAVSANSWVKAKPTETDESSPGFIERKVKALLNKLTAEKFDSISDQILEWANKSKNETDGMSLKLVIKQVFEKATDEAHWSEMYARLCRKILDRLDPAVSEEIDGKMVSGGSLFRKYLIGRCQMDFEAGWKAREDAATAAAAKSEEDKQRLAQQTDDKEAVMLSDEYYIAQKAKRRGLGLVQLIGELFKLEMISHKVIRGCLQRLLTNTEDPDEEDIESTCKLLTTVGGQFEAQSKDTMDSIMERLSAIEKLDSMPSRIKFMIMDISDLRRNSWRSQKTAQKVMTIAEVHQQAARENALKAAQAVQASRDAISRGGSRSGRPRDEWQSTPQPARLPQRPADMSGLGKMSGMSTGPSFAGPTSVFAKKGKITTPPMSRQASTTNLNKFSALDAAEEEPQRKKLQLLPKSEPEPEPESEPAVLGEDAAKAKIDTDCKELWGEKDQGGSRNPDDIVEYFKTLPDERKELLAVRLADDVFRIAKLKDAEVVSKGWAAALEQNAVTLDVLKRGLETRMETLDDDSIDFPAAYKAVALIMRDMALSDEEIAEMVSKVVVYGESSDVAKAKLDKAFDEI